MRDGARLNAMPTQVSLNILDRVGIASACTARWEDMAPTGDDHVRRCSMCSLDVHDLSAMGRAEAEALLASHLTPGGANQGRRLCGSLRRRADGTIIFGDCPVGLARARAAARRSTARVAALVGLASVLGAALTRAERSGWRPGDSGSFLAVARWLGVSSGQSIGPRVVGELCAPPFPSPAPTPPPPSPAPPS
jgi:hypothetical protein